MTTPMGTQQSLCSRLFVKILSTRVAVEEVMRVGLEIKRYRLLKIIRLMNSLEGWWDYELRILILKSLMR